MASAETVWHGNNRKEAIKRAKQIRGVVIRSWSPATGGGYGYYSEPKGAYFLRNGETQIYPKPGRDR